MSSLKNNPFSILFVCMGNICRSPAAEGVMQKIVDDAGLSEHIRIDSAGTIGYHSGEPADSRMRSAASARGYELTSLARQVRRADLDDFDMILTMDDDNLANTRALADTPEQQRKVEPFVQYCTEHDDPSVPDPYYGGAQGFEHVLDLLEDGCHGLLEEIQTRRL